MDTLRLSYLGVLDEVAASLDRLSQLAQEKTDAVRQDDLIALDEVLKQDQAMALNLRGLEQRRLKLAKQLGLEGTSLSDLPQHYAGELEDRAWKTVERLRDSYTVFRSCADMARNALELDLHKIEKVITASGADPVVASAGYEAPGVEPPSNMKTDFRA